MRTLTRAAVAAACTAGLTAGALAMAAPAMAAGSAQYNCGTYGNPVGATFDRIGSNLRMRATISFWTPIPVTITSTLDGATGPSGSAPAGSSSSITLVGAPTTTLSAAPNTIKLMIAPVGVTVTCTLIGSGTGFPV